MAKKFNNAYFDDLNKEDEDEQILQTPEEEKEPEEVKKVSEKNEEETFKKRYGDLRRFLQQKEQEWENAKKQLQNQVELATKSQLRFPKNPTDEEITEWIDKYPDVASMINAVIAKQTTNSNQKVENATEQLKELQVNIAREKALTDLLKIHPDFLSIREDQAFHDWLATKSKSLQDIMYIHLDPIAAADVVTMYKAQNKVEKKNPEKDKKSAAEVVSKGTHSTPDNFRNEPGVFRESQVNKMNAREFDKNEDAIMESIRAGKFIYDVSHRDAATAVR